MQRHDNAPQTRHVGHLHPRRHTRLGIRDCVYYHVPRPPEFTESTNSLNSLLLFSLSQRLLENTTNQRQNATLGTIASPRRVSPLRL
jgi:hypothetical protein